MNKQLTAMQELIEWLNIPQDGEYSIRSKAKELLSKEKEQIEQAFVAGDERGVGNIPFNAEQYFTQTYQCIKNE